MATKKSGTPTGGRMPGGRVVLAGVAVALISSVSSFIAIRFALPKQIIVTERVIQETPKPAAADTEQGDLWTLADPFIVNLADATHHYLKVNISLRVSRPAGVTAAGKGGEGAADPAKAVMARMKPLVPVYRDAIIGTLRRQTVASLFDQDRVKDEIKVQLNILNQNDPTTYPKTLDVYFSEFVIQ